MNYFWSYTVWYVLLGITTVLELAYIMIKVRKRRQAFAFYLTLLGITLNFETAILIFLKSYAYYPMILPSAPNFFDDILAGNLFSQFSVATTALLVVIFDLNYFWFFILALMYGLIEELFLALGIYRHNWYQTWMTVAGLPVFFWMAKKMYAKMINGIKPVLYYGYIFLGLFPLYVITVLWGLSLSGYVSFDRTLFSDPINSYYFLTLSVFFIPPAMVMLLLHFSKLKWIWKTVAVILLYVFYYWTYRLKLVWIKEGWFLAISTGMNMWMYLSVLIIDRLYGQKGNKNS